MIIPAPYRDALRRLPHDWDILVGADTGTYMSALVVGIPPGDEPRAVALAEFPNYRYVSGELELLGYTTPEWSRAVLQCVRYLHPRGATDVDAWADPNTQFRGELRNYHLHLRSNTKGPELRTELSREYFQLDRILLMPWLSVLPYELEHAKWPDEESATGAYKRLKTKDHTLDCLEHVLSRRPQPASAREIKKKSFLQQQYEIHKRQDRQPQSDPHLGVL